MVVITLPMRTRLIYSKIWKDKFFVDLNDKERNLFFYFLTNDLINIIHLYECPERVIMFETNTSAEELQAIKYKFQANKKFYFYKDYVLIANASRYQQYNGERNEQAKEKLWSQLPKDVLDWYYSISDTPYIPPRYPLKPKPKPKPNKKEEINKEEEIDIDEIDEALRTKSN